ncbi:MAG: DISARM system phospholipase D-like protein DrmC [Myxococcota bacterium]
MSGLARLAAHELELLAAAVADGRLAPPLSDFALRRVLGRSVPADVIAELSQLLEGGAPAALRWGARLAAQQPAGPELVWTGPDETRALRATATVMEELFLSAQQRLFMSGFAVVKGAAVFSTLAEVMAARPQLEVVLVLNVHARDGVSAEETIAWFAEAFWARTWAGPRRPVVYYDPRSVDPEPRARAVMHAKCVVADGRLALVTSANFTPHAQARNIELGLRLDDEGLALRIEAQFRALIEAGHLVRLPG